MTWFKVDDQFHDHKKLRKLGDDRLAASGLWTHCGSWSGDNLSDGFVPGEVVRRWDPKCRLAERLVEVGLWEHAEVDGEPGYLFHEWEHHQPTRADVHKRREETRERVRKYRESRAAANAASNASSNSVGNSVTHARGDDERNADVLDPEGSRPEPDPARTSYGSTKGGSRKRSLHPMPDDWAPTDSHRTYAAEHGLDLRHEEQQFRWKVDAEGWQYKNWNSGFSTWLGNQAKWDAQRRNRGGLRAVSGDSTGWHSEAFR